MHDTLSVAGPPNEHLAHRYSTCMLPEPAAAVAVGRDCIQPFQGTSVTDRRHRLAAFLAAAVLFLSALWPAAAVASTVGWDDDDFLVAGFNSDTIGVYDSDLTFKHNLVTGFNAVTGLDFDAAGNLVAAGQQPRTGPCFQPRRDAAVELQQH